MEERKGSQGERATFAGIDPGSISSCNVKRLPDAVRFAVSAQGSADFPVVSEGVDDASEAPAIGLGNRADLGCARGDCLGRTPPQGL